MSECLLFENSDHTPLRLGGEMTFMVGIDDNGHPVTTLAGTLDQAALQGLLRRLYSYGLPLISVICVDYS